MDLATVTFFTNAVSEIQILAITEMCIKVCFFLIKKFN